MIISRTPLRVSFFGGGTDIDYYFKKKGGKVISAAINKYVYVIIKPHHKVFGKKYRVSYSKTENVDNLSHIQNNIVKECLKFTKIKSPLYIGTFADIPDRSGLGSSSSFTVGLLNALYYYMGKKVSKKQLAEDAYYIETKLLKNPIGKQDQYAASYGGFNSIEFKKNDQVKVKKIPKHKKIINLFKSILLVWTGLRRDNKNILLSQKLNINNNVKSLDEIKFYVGEFEKCLRKKEINLEKVGKLLNKSWNAKMLLSKKIMNLSLKNFSKKLKKEHIHGLKLLGAGGGGFFLCIVKNLKPFPENYLTIKIKVDQYGSKIFKIK